MSTTRWFRVGPIAEAKANAPLVVDADGIEIAVFHVRGAFSAIDNSCPHAGGPLAEGVVDGHVVECPWHGWSFDVRTGACRTTPSRKAHRYPLREIDGVLEVGLPAL